MKLKPTSEIKARLGIEPNGRVQKFYTNTCYKYMSPNVPGGTKSHLNQSVSISSDSITYQSPDAHYHYIGKLYVDPKYNKGAFFSSDYGYWSRPGITKKATDRDLNYTVGGSQWVEKTKTLSMDKIIEETERYMRSH